MVKSDWVKDSDTEHFVTDVIESSKQRLVVVNFWSSRSSQCKDVATLLGKLAVEGKGSISLVKVDVDQSPEIARQMRIQSVPATYLFKGGRPLDGFMGTLPENKIRLLLERHLGCPLNADAVLDELLAQAKMSLEAGDAATALGIFQKILGTAPENVTAIAGFLRAAAALGKVAMAEKYLSELPEALRKNSEIAAATTAVTLAIQASTSAGNSAQLAEILTKNENDHQVRFDLAMALYADGQQGEAVEHLLELFRRDRNWNDDGARKQLVTFFEALGHTHPLTINTRKRLSSLMFS